MKKKKLLLVSYLVTGLSFWGMSQNTYVGNYVIPPSPDASALVRAVNTPVDKYSGTANVNIPLYTVAFGDLSVPIALNYHASGIKVEDIATSVGLGWQLSAGGKITRVVRHYPDEQGYSALTNDHGSQIRDMSTWKSNNFDARLKDYDTEPDLFYFEIPGRSGMFVVDYDHKAYTIPYQCLKIRWVDNEYFTITDEQGVRYTFGKTAASREETQTTVKEEDSSKEMNFVSTWNLDMIKSTVGDTINFTYQAGADYEFTMYNSKRLVKYEQKTNKVPTLDIVKTVNMDTRVKIKSPKYPKTVQWATGSLNFATSGERRDLTNALKLSEIRINYALNGEQYLRSIKFEYSTFSNKALKLERVYEVKGLLTLPINRFEYYTDYNFPDRNSFAYDHWGYFNGKTNNNKGYPPITILSKSVAGDDRNPDINFARTNSIKRVYYATGGYREFEYDAHKSANGSIVGGLRINKIKEKDIQGKEELVTSYAYSNKYGYSGGDCFQSKPVHMYRYASVGGSTIIHCCVCQDKPLNALSDINGVIVGYPTVKETLPNGGYTVYHFHSYPDAPDETHRVYDVIGSQYYSTLTNEHTPNTSKFWLRGRMKSQVTYNASGIKIDSMSICYSSASNIKREIIACAPYYAGEGMDFGGGVDLRIPLIGVYKWISQPTLTDTIRIGGKSQPAMTTIYKYNPDYLVPVEVETKDASVNFTTKVTYTYFFNYPNTAMPSQFFPYALRYMRLKHMISVPVETVQYRNNQVTAGTIREYKVIPANGGGKCVVPAQTRELLTPTPLNSYTPYKVRSNGIIIADPHYQILSYNDEYSRNGKLIRSHAADGNAQGIIYGYGGSLPIAQVENAIVAEKGQQNEAFYTSFEEDATASLLSTAKSGNRALKKSYSIPLANFKPGTYRLTYWKSTDGSHWEKATTPLTVTTSTSSFAIGSTAYYIDEVRVLPENARISTCTWLPGVGKTSETDHNGQSIYYEYDGFGRLVKVLDSARRPLREYEYKLLNN